MKYGPLTPERYQKIVKEEGLRLEVHIDGETVTERCFFADDIEGIVKLFKHDAQGKMFVEGESLATEERRGHVVIKP